MSRALYSDSDMPQGTPSSSPYFSCRHTTSRLVSFQQAACRRAHHQRRHQIFEHRSGPGDQARTAVDRRQGAAQPEPVLGGHIALGDGDEARQPRFGRQQVVEIGIETAVAAAIADGKELAVGIEQKAEFHRHRTSTLARSAIAARRCDSDRAAPADFSSAAIKGARLLGILLAVRQHLQIALAVRRQRGQRRHRVQQCGDFVAGPAVGGAGSPRASANRSPADARARTRARPPPRR